MPAKPIKILVVDDEPQIRRLLKTSLSPHGFEIVEAGTAAAALAQLRAGDFEIVILDLGLPDQSGLDVIETIRSTSLVPIIILSVRDDDGAKVRAFESGADDYVTKPFSVPELLARLRASLRHRFHQQGTTPVLTRGALKIDLVNRLVTFAGNEIRLSKTEFDLLRLLAEHAGRVLTHHFILKNVWGEAKTDDVQYLRVYVRALRQKLALDPVPTTLIQTEPGIGYRLVCDDHDQHERG